MKKQEIIAFFDRLAPEWDAEMIRSDEKIAFILDAAGVCAGSHVLDVACGTGVLFSDYLARGVGSVTAVDISPEMARIAAAKTDDPRLTVRCGDVETMDFERQFDCCVVYNAFPHFKDPQRLIDRLASLLAPGGRLCVAHGMSLEALHKHHEHARHVSRTMLNTDEMTALMKGRLQVETVVSDEEKYVVAARRAD